MRFSQKELRLGVFSYVGAAIAVVAGAVAIAIERSLLMGVTIPIGEGLCLLGLIAMALGVRAGLRAKQASHAARAEHVSAHLEAAERVVHATRSAITAEALGERMGLNADVAEALLTELAASSRIRIAASLETVAFEGDASEPEDADAVEMQRNSHADRSQDAEETPFRMSTFK
jgi:hypothetical protein